MTVADLQPASNERVSESVSSTTDVGGLCELGESLRRLVKGTIDRTKTLEEVIKRLATLRGVHAAVSLRSDGSGSFSLATPLVCSRPLLAVDSVLDLLRQSSTSVSSHGSMKTASLPKNSGLTAVVAPLSCCGPHLETLCLVVDGDAHALDLCVVIVQLAAAEIASWAATSESADLKALPMLSMISRIVSVGEPRAAYYALASDLRSILGCRQVAIGACRRRNGRCHIEAISGVQNFNRQSTVVNLMEAVMEETIIARALCGPGNDESVVVGGETSAQRDLAQATDAAHVVCRPLRDHGGKVIGAWVAVDDGDGGGSKVEHDMQRAADAVASCLSIVRNMNTYFARRLVTRIASVDGAGRRLAASLLFAVVVLAMLIPMPYKVSCECVLQPVARKYVAVPYDGVLEKVLVEPGDVTGRGQVLAQMDVREIQWELAGVHADHSRSQKQLDANLAARDTASAQLAKLELERLEVKIRLLENRANHLEIKSPIDGVVISGDPRKTEGARLTIGQTLFEVGPLNRMVAELEVPDEDVSHIAVGQSVDITLEAYLRRTLRGTVARIHPRSEMRDQENVFRAEVLIDNSRRLLRPGMRGHARVRTANRALAWNLFHKAWHRILLSWGW